MVQFHRTRRQRLLSAVANLRNRALDALYSPVTKRLTVDEYFTCRTRTDCLAAYVKRRRAEEGLDG